MLKPVSRMVRTQAMAWRRRAYRLRAFVPGLRERHRLEAMVGPLGYWDELRAYQIRLQLENGLQPAHHFLDIGCGPLQGGVEFIRHLEPGRYVGVDIHPEKLAAAHQQVVRHRLAAKQPVLLQCDRFGDPHLDGRRFDRVWASQVLYYFDDEHMKRLFEFLSRRLASGGRFLGDIIGRSHPDYSRASTHAFLGAIELQSVERFGELAQPFGFRARSLGEIAGFGYPRRLSLRTNELVEITHR